MKEKIRNCLTGNLVRPLIYMIFTRFLLALTAVLLAEFFMNSLLPVRQYAAACAAALFAFMAWIAYLRLDKARLPKPMMKRVHIRKKPTRTYGDMIDHVDDDIVSFDDLEDDEKDVCCLMADLFCCAAMAVLSALS